MDVNTFPLSFSYHLIFCLIAGCFFLLQYLRLHRPYQLILTVAIPASLLIYLGRLMEKLGLFGAADFFNGKSWFHTIGAFECIMLVGALVLSIVMRIRQKKQPADDELQDGEGETA